MQKERLEPDDLATVGEQGCGRELKKDETVRCRNRLVCEERVVVVALRS